MTLCKYGCGREADNADGSCNVCNSEFMFSPLNKLEQIENG